LIAGLAATVAAALAFTGGAAAQGSCLGAAVTIPGTPGDDVLPGTEGNDVIDAQGGNDLIDGAGGDDLICAGTGADLALGGVGNDRVEGGTEADLLVGDLMNPGQQVASGDDDVAGGAGLDVVVGDAVGDGSQAAGEGDDKVNGGDQNDLVIGDAYSSSLAVGTGDDDLDSGPGTDIVIGDAMVGTPSALAAGQSAPRQDVGSAGAYGSGGDTMNTQTEDDFLVGDAANFNRPSGGRGSDASAFLDAASSHCGKRLTRQILRKAFRGFSDEEIADFVEDVLLAEFMNDMLVGDCFSALAAARGGGPDRLNGGTDNDGGFGGNVGGTVVSGTGADKDDALGGKGDDCLIGDGGLFGLEVLFDEVRMSSEVEVNDIARCFFGFSFEDLADWEGPDLSTTEPELEPPENIQSELDFVLVIARGGGAGDLSGGGADDLRGGQGSDGLVGGPKKDKCSGGSQKDGFAEKGPDKCEKITGSP
jgi:Ca2+-binding RTX toxin-like protein